MLTLRELAAAVPEARLCGEAEVEIQELCYDSRQATAGSCFIAIRGLITDGHKYISQALERGASAVVLEDEALLNDLPPSLGVLLVPDSRTAMAQMAAEFYGHPSRDMLLVAVTGTNGKTTVAHLVAGLLRQAGLRSVALIGTLGASSDQLSFDVGRTTPESLDLQRMLAEFLETGSEAVVMEVSSHALSLQRVRCCAFDAGIFTNLTQDHLNFHATMEDYFAAKASLFTEVARESEKYKTFGAVLNVDDHYGRRLRDEACAESLYVTYGIENEAHVQAEGLHLTAQGSSCVIRSSTARLQVDLQLVGRFNVYNALACAAFGFLREIPAQDIQKALQSAPPTEGRMEAVQCGQNFHVAVDYAHTPDGLKNVMSTARECTTGKLIVVFGCGGDRDRTKRPQMGAIAASFADLCIVTSDNPRTEDPDHIIAEIMDGTTQGNAECIIEADRRTAIHMALDRAAKGDFVLIAGKGHETYQIFRDQTIHFDDREVVREYLWDKAARETP